MAPPPFLRQDWMGLTWSEFVPFAASGPELTAFPSGAGVSRVGVDREEELAAVGQTGRNLRERLAGLVRSALAVEMRCNGPPTAAPRLWSFRQAEGLAYEVSAATIDVPKGR